MLVRELMSSPAITVSPETSIKEALRVLDANRVTSLPVVSDRGDLVGIVSEADLLKGALYRDLRTSIIPREDAATDARAVEDVMTVLSLTVRPDSDLSDAADLMTGTAVKSLPVVEDRRVVGVVSRSDIVHLLAHEDEQISAEIDELLRSAGIEYQVEVSDGRVLLEGSGDPHLRRIAQVIAGSVAGVLAVEFSD